VEPHDVLRDMLRNPRHAANPAFRTREAAMAARWLYAGPRREFIMRLIKLARVGLNDKLLRWQIQYRESSSSTAFGGLFGVEDEEKVVFRGPYLRDHRFPTGDDFLHHTFALYWHLNALDDELYNAGAAVRAASGRQGNATGRAEEDAKEGGNNIDFTRDWWPRLGLRCLAMVNDVMQTSAD